MATESSPLDELKDLLAKDAPSAGVWRDSLPTLRARASATSIILRRLAKTPVSVPPQPRSPAVEVILVAPSRDWAEDIERRLVDVLPQAKVDLVQDGELLPDAPPPVFIIQCEVRLPKVSHADAVDAVLRAFRSMDGVEVDYSIPIDLVVVAPGLDTT